MASKPRRAVPQHRYVDEISWLDYGLVPGMRIRVGHVRDHVITHPSRLTEMTRNKDIYPREYEGVIEDLYPRFAIVRLPRHTTTVHLFDLVCGRAKVEVLYDKR